MRDNPFTPGYGEAPPYLAGRIDLVNEIIAQIRRGPGRSEYHHILIGPRGTGKTSTITNVAEQLSDAHDGLTVRWTAGTRPLAEAIEHSAADIESALGPRLRRPKLDTAINVGIPGATASATSRAKEHKPQSTFYTLQRIARRAGKKNRTILLWIDEAQRATPDEIAILAGAMQELANVERLPITICAAGLPDTRSNWITAASSLERQQFTTFGNLDREDTAAAIEIPIRDAGRTIDPDALDLLVTASKGFPYAIQLMAAKAWDEATGDSTLTIKHITPAIAASIEQLREQLYESRYRQMPAGIRAYVHAAASLQAETGTIQSNVVAERLGVTTQQASMRRDELINTYQVLVSPRRNELEFTTPGFAEWLRQQRATPSRTPVGSDDNLGQFLGLPLDSRPDNGPGVSI